MDSVGVRVIVIAAWLSIATLLGLPFGASAATTCSGLGCHGINIANFSLEAQGQPYVLGSDPRGASVRPSYDCSSLVKWAF